MLDAPQSASLNLLSTVSQPQQHAINEEREIAHADVSADGHVIRERSYHRSLVQALRFGFVARVYDVPVAFSLLMN